MAGAVAITPTTTAMAVAQGLNMAVVVAMTMAVAVAMAMAMGFTVAMAMAMAVVAIRINGRLRHTGWSMPILAGDRDVSGGDGTLRSNGGGASDGVPTGVFRLLAMTRWP